MQPKRSQAHTSCRICFLRPSFPLPVPFLGSRRTPQQPEQGGSLPQQLGAKRQKRVGRSYRPPTATCSPTRAGASVGGAAAAPPSASTSGGPAWSWPAQRDRTCCGLGAWTSPQLAQYCIQWQHCYVSRASLDGPQPLREGSYFEFAVEFGPACPAAGHVMPMTLR